MKSYKLDRPSIHLIAAASSLAWLTTTAIAAPFLYSPGDLVLAFRQEGNAVDLVVNAGAATNLSSLPADTTLPIGNLSASQLTLAFPSINTLRWSVAAANRPPLVSEFPLQTIWVTAPRLDVAVQSPAWLRRGQFVQGTAASQIDAIGANASSYSSRQPAGPDNTATGIAIPVANDAAFTLLIGPAGDYVGTFQGDAENTTPDDFDGNPENVSRSDLYELVPATTAAGTISTPGRHLGYFELKPDGTLTFNTKSAVVPSPEINGIERQGNVTTVSFTSIDGPTYRLRATDGAGFNTPISTWPTGNSATGTGSILELQDTSDSPIRFYVVEVIP